MRNACSRRKFLAYGAGISLSTLAFAADEEIVPFRDYGPEFQVDAQADDPHVKCFDLRRLASAITPTREFFEFHQTQTVRAESETWRLRIGGHVKRPAEFSLRDLLNRAGQRELEATIECSGNTADPRIMNGLVSNAIWRGVSLSAILEQCGIEPSAREVVFLGMDTEPDRKWEAGNAEYSSPHGWSIFLQDAQAASNLLAFAMNGEPLTPEHGFPLRLILPGWYGMAQIKWLSRIELTDRHYEGRHMARNYQSLRAVKSGEETLWLDTSISRNNLKSVIARVTRRRGGTNFQYRVTGAAWGGPAAIRGVELSVDNGPWRPAIIDRPGNSAAWSLWSFDWKDATPGLHTLMSRASNTRGEIQPTREELRAALLSNREDNAQWLRSVLVKA
jgi:DMSO/TMAO reductase YedYZ molybdopterin-dependent catalytic subunit